MIRLEALNSIRGLIRGYGNVTLVAATKTQTKETIEALHEYAPEVVMGENRVQELVEKYDGAMRWHMIGQLQTNKVKYILDKAELIHSLDRVELAQEIDKRAAKIGKTQACLVEVNMGGEASKGGVDPNETEEFICGLSRFEHLKIEGIMSVLPAIDDRATLESLYRRLRDLFEAVKKISSSNVDVKYLSAGMTNDYMIALDHGANIIRIGRAIFGERTK